MDCAIKITPNYYAGTCNAPQEHYATEDEILGNQCNDIWTGSRQEAQDWIDEHEDGTYYLSHGEAGRPNYEIETPNSYSCQSASGTKLDGYIEIPADEIPTDILAKLERINVEYHRSGDDYDIYIGTHDAYAIAYCPRSLSIQCNADDLGGINWTDPAYYRIDEYQS